VFLGDKPIWSSFFYYPSIAMKFNVAYKICAIVVAVGFSQTLAQVAPSLNLNSILQYPVVQLFLSTDVNNNLSIEPVPAEHALLIQFLEDRLDLRFKIERLPWKRALSRTIAGDGFLFGVSKTKERLQVLDFSEPLFEDHAWLVTRCDCQFSFKTLADLKNKTIGIVRGTSVGEAFDAEANKSFRIEDDTDATEARFIKLDKGRMDALVFYKRAAISREVLARDLNQRYAPKRENKKEPVFCVLEKPVATISIHIAVKKAVHQQLLQRLNEVIVSARFVSGL
jgi:hypothetical protein